MNLHCQVTKFLNLNCHIAKLPNCSPYLLFNFDWAANILVNFPREDFHPQQKKSQESFVFTGTPRAGRIGMPIALSPCGRISAGKEWQLFLLP